MRILLIDNETTLLTKLQALIPGDKVVRRYSSLCEADSDSYDLVILSGGSHFPIEGNEEKLKSEIDLIKNSHRPIIGICFGCELIAYSFGSTLSRLPRKQKGIVEIEVIADPELFGGRDSFTAYENHRYTVERLPNDLVALARSDHGIEAIKHKTRHIYGLQFHPENFVEQTYGDEIFFNLLKMFKK